MNCRQCGACCIAISISSLQKPANVRCKYLTKDNKCEIFNDPNRPEICSAFQPDKLFCGKSREEAILNYKFLETTTDPEKK